MSSITETGAASPAPWHAAYPAPKAEASAISREDVLSMLRSGESVAGKTFVLVDLRRNDHEVGHTCQDFLYKMMATGYFCMGE